MSEPIFSADAAVLITYREWRAIPWRLRRRPQEPCAACGQLAPRPYLWALHHLTLCYDESACAARVEAQFESGTSRTQSR